MNKKNNLEASHKRGIFVVIYGVNNLGKTTQAKLLVNRLKKSGYRSEYLKYPLYDFKPTGPMINRYLRKNNPDNFSPREAQLIFALNRSQFQSRLLDKLNKGINIIAEDYVSTGMAWGICAGVEKKFLKSINGRLLKENLAFLFIGRRFTEGQEHNHRHESDKNLINRVGKILANLGRESGWIKINANLNKRKVHEQIWKKVIKLINR